MLEKLEGNRTFLLCVTALGLTFWGVMSDKLPIDVFLNALYVAIPGYALKSVGETWAKKGSTPATQTPEVKP